MRLAAALLTLMATGALAQEPPSSVIYYGDEQGFRGEAGIGHEVVRQPRQQPYSGILGQTEGSNWRSSNAPEGPNGVNRFRQPGQRGYINSTELWDWRKAAR